ncbi:MAG: helix-turn-helix transcriptional regulator [Bacilli bacterium]|nr:helix-turn-helix transcriptional regulator [Bacilli bacterium]
MKTFALLSDESRLFHLGEYQERKKLLKQLSFVKNQLGKIESTYLSLVLSGKEKLDRRVASANRVFTIWKESEHLLIAGFRAETIDVSPFIKECREGLGMSQAEVASILGVSAKTYSNYEKGRTMIGTEVFLMLTRLLSSD